MAQRLDPIELAPAKAGVCKTLSPLALANRWIDADKVRFKDGKPQKIGGWSVLTTQSVEAPIRGQLLWETMRSLAFAGFGTYRKLHLCDLEWEPHDITPVDTTGSLTNPFTTEAATNRVNVLHVDHGRNPGDEVSFSGASAVSNLTVDGAYEVVEIIDEDNYIIEHASMAVGTATGGGTVNYSYELPVGLESPIQGDGYGAGAYGIGDYGAPSEGDGSIIVEPRVWSLDQYGDLMVAAPGNAYVYLFDPADTPAYQRAERLTNSPICRGAFVTPERFIFALGCNNNPMLVMWPDQEDPTNWTPGFLTTANQRRLREGSKIVTGRALADLISGVWTDTALYAFQYTGSSFIYDSKCVGTNCGLYSPQALVVTLGTAYWASHNGFFYWSGGAPANIPNSEDIEAFVDRHLRLDGYEYKVNAHFNAEHNEITWYYVGGTDAEPGFYVTVSLDDYSWVNGTLERTSGGFFRSGDRRPILAGADGYLYQHEDGFDANGAVMQAYITRGMMQLANGTQLAEITTMFNDMERQTGVMSIDVTTYERKNEELDNERVSFEPDEDLVDIGIAGRIAKVTLRSEVLGGDFRLGNPMLDLKAIGGRRL